MRIARSRPSLLFIASAFVAAAGAFVFVRANQGSIKVSDALPANTIIVTNTNDSGPGSLRDALATANDGDTIDATGVSGTILLTSGELEITDNVTINGPGAGHLAVDGNGQSRGFFINAGKTVTISGLTITNGNVTNDFGSGIYNDGGALTLSECTVTGNAAGGAILNDSFNSSATMIVTGCTVSGNTGGGISNRGSHTGATMTVTNCTVSGNSGYGLGNGGVGGRATMMVTNSTISGNSGRGMSNGAGLAGGSATLTVTSCTISGNTGGGISNGDAGVTIINSTVSGNSADWGGGIVNGNGQGRSGVVAISNSTISGNWAGYGGGGIASESTNGGGTLVTIRNSTISGNSAAKGGGIYNANHGGGTTLELGGVILKGGSLGENILNLGGMVTSYGYSLSSDDGGGVLIGPGDRISTDPLLGPLQDNGGPTFTHAVLLGSPAIDAGDPNFTPPPLYDQRGPGFARVANSRIDIGSFEVQAGLTPTPTPCSSWSPAVAVPYNAGGMFAASDGTYVYTGGGGDINAGHKALLRYNPGNGSWTSLAPSPDEHALSQAVYCKGKLYNIGGFLGDLSQVSDTTRIYDIQANTWTTGAAMPARLGAPATMLWNGVIYVAGGFDGTQAVDTLYAYDIASDTWTTRAPMPQTVYAPGFAAINGKLYVAAGYLFGVILDTLQIYDIASNTWSFGHNNVPQRVGFCGSTTFNGQLYLYGGVVQENPRLLTNTTQIYDPVSDTWSNGPTMNVTKWWVYGTAVGNQTIVAPGGVNANVIGFNDNEQLINIPCATPTPTVTPTPTATPTPTTTATATPSATARPSPTTRPRPTPVPRP
jgi:hypothetical protein